MSSDPSQKQEDGLSFLRAGQAEVRLVSALSSALNVSRLHDLENVAVGDAVATLSEIMTRFLRTRERAVLLITEARVYLNGRQVRSPTSGHSFLDDTVAFMARMGLGGLLFSGSWTGPSIRQLLGIFRHVDKEVAAQGRVSALKRAVASLPPASVFALMDPRQAKDFVKEEEEGYASERERAAYYFARLLTLLETSHTSIQAGLGPDIHSRHLRQTVMGIIDRLDVPAFEARLLAMTAMQPLDDAPLVSHVCNVGILSVLMGRLLGLKRAGLADLFYAGLHHDLGRAGHPRGDAYEDPVTAELHVVRGLKHCLRARNYGNMGLLRMIVAQEHHRVADAYPDDAALREPHLFSQIVAVADAYDRLQNGQGGMPGIGPKDALEALRADGRYPAAVTQLLYDSLGEFPRGTTLRLWDGSVGVVVSGGARRGNAPIVRRILTPDQAPDDERPLLELTNAATNSTVMDPAEMFIDWRGTALE